MVPASADVNTATGVFETRAEAKVRGDLQMSMSGESSIRESGKWIEPNCLPWFSEHDPIQGRVGRARHCDMRAGAFRFKIPSEPRSNPEHLSCRRQTASEYCQQRTRGSGCRRSRRPDFVSSRQLFL